jgi:hypothetical protein
MKRAMVEASGSAGALGMIRRRMGAITATRVRDFVIVATVITAHEQLAIRGGVGDLRTGGAFDTEFFVLAWEFLYPFLVFFFFFFFFFFLL